MNMALFLTVCPLYEWLAPSELPR
jgi:hypothetical protein